MPKLIIDNQEIKVPSGTKVIEAAAQLGIMIPRFCYHPALGAVGACRVCAVKFLDGPVTGIRMSCMIEAQDRLVVSTTDPSAVDFRKQVIELLMLHHPHDCPVCDEGGQCLLQDTTVSGGHGIREYPGNKRTFLDQNLGPLLSHEMNRCIHCYRCARFYQEFTGYTDLGTMGIGNRTYFGRFKPGNLESPFAGNLSDLCPTGVFTDKPSRYRGRRWDYERTPSLCVHCSLGCHTVVSTRHRKIERQEARFSEKINGHFICDRGRFGFSYACNENRPTSARSFGQETSLDQALKAVGKKLSEITKKHDPSTIAVAGSQRCSLETQVMLKSLCQSKGWPAPALFFDRPSMEKVKSAIKRLEPELTVSLREIEDADLVLAIGVDPVQEAPMLAMAMRQAWRKGAQVFVFDPRPVELPMDFTHVALHPGRLNLALAAIFKTAVPRAVLQNLGQDAVDMFDRVSDTDRDKVMDPNSMTEIKDAIEKSSRPIIVCGSGLVSENTNDLASDCAVILRAMDKKAGLFQLLPGANDFCAGLLDDAETSFQEILSGIQMGFIDALVLVESNPFDQAIEPRRLHAALEKLDLLVVIDYLPSQAVELAQVFLPSSTLYESGGMFINQEGTMQAASVASSGVLSTDNSSEENHPPRDYHLEQPLSCPIPAWKILAHLERVTAGEKASVSLDSDWEARAQRLSKQFAEYVGKAVTDFGGVQALKNINNEGLQLHPVTATADRFSFTDSQALADSQPDMNSLDLLFVDWTFGTETLSSKSPCLQELEHEPYAQIHITDAEHMGLSHGDQVVISVGKEQLEMDLRVVTNMAPGILVVPRHRKLAWQKLATEHMTLARKRIRKMTK